MDIETTFYKVTRVCNVFSRQKLEMTDLEGNTWYRYTEPNFTTTIDKFTITGLVYPTVIGDLVPTDDDTERGEVVFLHCMSETGGYEVIREDDLTSYITLKHEYFLSLEEATEAVNKLIQ